MPVTPRRSVAVPDPSAAEAVANTLRAAGCVFAEEEAALLVEAATTAAGLEAMVLDRVAGRPLEQIVGWAEFCGLRIHLEPGVFVPRRRSQLLVTEAVLRARDRVGRRSAPLPVVDLCCGSGALGVAFATAFGPARVELHAADCDPAAVRCARAAVETVGGRVHEGDLYAALPGGLRGRVGVLLANAPYVPTDAIATMPPEARDHEPATALDGGTDGLHVLRRVIEGAPAWLAPGGVLLVEVSGGQVAAAGAALRRAGLAAAVVTDPELGATALIGTAPDSTAPDSTADGLR